MSGDTTIISKDTVKRLIRDVRAITSEPLTDHGIHYQHSDEDLLKGQALIIGPGETPYSDGFYLFDISYPYDYPHRPPTVKFCTNDGVTRMNPNLYMSGKVCVSILNTWRGEAWTGCQTISTMLLALVSLLNSEPLLNEPGITSDNPDFATYNSIIQYKNVETAIHMVLTSSSLRKHYQCFVNTMESHFIRKYDDIIRSVMAMSLCPDILTTRIYRMHVVPRCDHLLGELELLYNKLAKLK
jgi:ubiquitin-conjugating enzyme E2 Z